MRNDLTMALPTNIFPLSAKIVCWRFAFPNGRRATQIPSTPASVFCCLELLKLSRHLCSIHFALVWTHIHVVLAYRITLPSCCCTDDVHLYFNFDQYFVSIYFYCVASHGRRVRLPAVCHQTTSTQFIRLVDFRSDGDCGRRSLLLLFIAWPSTKMDIYYVMLSGVDDARYWWADRIAHYFMVAHRHMRDINKTGKTERTFATIKKNFRSCSIFHVHVISRMRLSFRSYGVAHCTEC